MSGTETFRPSVRRGMGGRGMKLVALCIGTFMALFPVLTFAWGVYEGIHRRPPCSELSHGGTP
jgi:hypothetical protein